MVALAGAFVLLTAPAQAKVPGATHCYNGICHRVKTLAETRKAIGQPQVLQASFYDDCSRDRFNPCTLTSSGEVFRPDQPDNAASPTLPDGTQVLVWHPRTRRALVVRINNAGPYWGRRTLDLSRAAADQLGFRHGGVATLRIKVLSAPTSWETTYVRRRRYKPVPGFIGRFPSLEAAFLTLSQQHVGYAVSPVYAVSGRQPPRRRASVLAALPRLVDDAWAYSAIEEPPREIEQAPAEMEPVPAPERADDPSAVAAIGSVVPVAPVRERSMPLRLAAQQIGPAAVTAAQAATWPEPVLIRMPQLALRPQQVPALLAPPVQAPRPTLPRGERRTSLDRGPKRFATR